jgi:transposase-like protein
MAAMSAATKAKKTRKRYTADEKNEIIAFIEKHDAENGRGGKSAAAKKFGISQISVGSWMKGKNAPAPSGKKRGRKAGSKNVKVAVAKESGFSGKLKELGLLADQIDKAEAELAKLHAKFQALKAAL